MMRKKIQWAMRLILIVGISLFLMLLLSIDGSGRTIIVDDDGGEDFTKIQDAINASQDGDTIRVYAGTYKENIIVNKSVGLIGNGSELTTINGGENGDVVSITADGVNLSGFYIDGSGSPYSGISSESNHNLIYKNKCSNNWNGILLSYSSYSTIMNNIFENNNHGIYLKWSSHSTITNNIYENSWYGIRVMDSSNNTITNNTIFNNNCGIYLSSVSKFNTAHYNNIFNNRKFGINATNNVGNMINATHNWWGDSSGPFHFLSNPDGKGDNVSNYVDFSHWLDEKSKTNEDDRDDDEGYDPLIQYILIIILFILLGILFLLIFYVYE